MWILYGIEVREADTKGMMMELRGDLDLSSLDTLRETLNSVASLREPTVVDLSGVTFLDLGCARELAIRAQLYAHHLSLCNPSWQVQSTIRSCGLEDWFRFRPAPDLTEPPVFSEIP